MTAARLIVYGDFNCPFSALASRRAAHLERLEIATVEWRAVEHAPDIPTQGRPVEGRLAADYARELDMVRDLLAPGEADVLRLPPRLSNTRLVTARYAARTDLRERLFAAYWHEGLDLGDEDTLTHLGAHDSDDATAARWHDEWRATGSVVIPTMVDGEGAIVPGFDALAHLAWLAAPRLRGDMGGEAPCFAHLLDDE